MATYEQRGKGKLWSVRFEAMTTEGMKHLRLSGYKTKKEAREAYENYQYEHRNVQPDPDKGMLFRDLCDAYYRSAAATMKESSLRETKARLENHVVPVLGKMYAADITPRVLTEWQADLCTRFSRRYVLAIRAALSAVWTFGAANYDISSSPLSRVPPPADTEEPEEMHIWTPEQFAAFAEAVEDPLWRLLFTTLYYTGARKGEALALGPADLMGNRLRINKSVTRKSSEPWKVTTPKNKQSVRTVIVPDVLVQDFRAYVADHPGRFVFGGDAPVADRSVDRAWNEGIKKASLPKIRIHDLRHSHASLLISSGVSIVAVSRRLGHKNTQETLNTYAHLLPNDDDMVLDVLQKFGSPVGSENQKIPQIS